MEKSITILKIGMIASIWSDIQMFGFILASFMINEHFINSNNFVDTLLFLMLVMLLVSKTLTSKFVRKFETCEDAIKYLEKKYQCQK